jgi:hypothetical protein
MLPVFTDSVSATGKGLAPRPKRWACASPMATFSNQTQVILGSNPSTPNAGVWPNGKGNCIMLVMDIT